MKEAVLKIIRERIADHEKVLSSPRTLPDAYSVVSAYRYECRAIMEEVSALPEQGYTREQIIGALEKGKSISDDCWPGTIGPYQYQKEKKLKDDYLSSITPVAVEAERTERWISTRDRWPEIGSLIVFVRDIDEPQYIAGVWTDEEQNWATMNRVILWTPLKPVTAEEVNNDKTK